MREAGRSGFPYISIYRTPTTFSMRLEGDHTFFFLFSNEPFFFFDFFFLFFPPFTAWGCSYSICFL